MRARCRSCGAPIWWAVTEAGKRIPLDEPDGVGNLIAWRDHLGYLRARSNPDPGPGEYLARSHFATCPHADAHRKPKEIR